MAGDGATDADRERLAALARARAAPRCGRALAAGGRCSEPFGHAGPHVDRAGGFVYVCHGCGEQLSPKEVSVKFCGTCGSEW